MLDGEVSTFQWTLGPLSKGKLIATAKADPEQMSCIGPSHFDTVFDRAGCLWFLLKECHSVAEGDGAD